MAKLICAATLDDALKVLSERTLLNEREGKRTVVFCEDKLTLLAERAVLSSAGGTFLTEVTTFARFLSGQKMLSKQGSVMEIASLIEENEEKLTCFRAGSAQAVYETIAQLSASRVGAELLFQSAEETEGALKNKLSDLALLLSSYEERLSALGLLDENGYLALLPRKLAELSNCEVFFFGFPSFTKQAQEGISAALRKPSLSVTGIFLAGREELYTNEGARVFLRLMREEGEAEISEQPSSLSGEALRLCRGLFSPERLSMPAVKTQRVRRFSAADEQEEFSAVAALVKKHAAEGMRYKDFAVLVGRKESLPLLEKTFRAYKIPFYADRKRPFSEHPFCRFALCAVTAVSDGGLLDSVDGVASSVYFGGGNEYRNYLLKYGAYRGGVRREIKEGEAVRGYDRENLVFCRKRMLEILSLFPRKGKGREFTEGVRALYRLVNAEEVTEKLSEYFTGAEREFLDPSPLFQVLEEFDLVSGGRAFSAREFIQTLKSGLSALEISMIPQYYDAVFVGDCTESKFERVKVLFITGLSDELPLCSKDTAVISDREIDRLKNLKVEIEPAIAQVNARARESLALNLCAFSEALYLSYPLQRGGGDLEPSEIFLYAEKLFHMPPMPDLFPYDCCEREPAKLKLFSLKNGFESGRERDCRQYSALYAALERAHGEGYAERLFGKEKEKIPDREMGEVSPTLLEKYFECPYAGFVSRALKLREREEKAVLDTDAGTFVHKVLEETAKRFNEFLSERECRSAAREIALSLLSSPRYAALSDTAKGGYTASRLVREGEEVSLAAYRQLKFSAFRVKETEGKITLPEISLSGKTDRIDCSDGYVRVIDYKTGGFDDSAAAYYTGRKLQLELYLRGASRGGIAAGAFYFPAQDVFSKAEEFKYRMSGFFCAEEDVISRMDPSLKAGEKSAFFEWTNDGKFTDKGMRRRDFEDFLDYSVLISARAEREMKEGNISPSPYEGACGYCKLRSLCGFVGDERKESGVKCSRIAEIVRRERGEE